MTKLEIYNLTLSIFNIEPITEEDIENKSRHQDVATLERWYQTALRKVIREHRWSFLEVPLELGKDLGGGHGYIHSYALPSDTFSVTWADGYKYIRIGNILYTDGNPDAFGIMDSLELDNKHNIPGDFYDLISLSLAYFTSYHFNPKIKASIAQDYQAVAMGLVSDMLRHERKDMGDI